jgi:PAS domain S-box-containing protein
MPGVRPVEARRVSGASLEPPRPASSAAILIADDHLPNLLALEAVLEPLGYELVRATGGQEALALIVERDFAVALLDVRMPDMDGFEVARQARQRRRRTPIIFVTATPDDSRLRARGYISGAFDYLVKPFEPDVLRSKVLAFVELWTQWEELRRQSEQHEAELERERFFRVAPDMFCIASRDACFKRVNPAFPKALGWDESELIGQPIFGERVLPEDRHATARELQRLGAATPTARFENRYLARDGSYKWLSWALALVPELDAIYAAARDITHQKQAEQELARALDRELVARADAEAREREIRRLNDTLEQRVRERTRELEEANRELESFSYSVSHDLRAPLRHITGFATLLQKKAGQSLDPALKGYVEAISEAAQEGGQLVDDLLSFSRMSRAALERAPVALDELVADVRREVMADATGRNVVWKVDPLPRVDADRAMLRLVLRNLLSNAIKYTRPRAEAVIEISAESAPAEVLVRVRDNGVGFDMRYVDKLFGVFQRLHTADQFEGTGIGLANVRRIVARHGGRTWAESAPDQGATFYFTLANHAEPTS